MRLSQRVLKRPRSLLLWRVNFQIHLWIGLLLTLYLVIIGLTGSILVFRTELERLSGLRPWPVHATRPDISVERAVQLVQSAYPDARLASINMPTYDQPRITATLRRGFARKIVRMDAQTGVLLPPEHRGRSWIDILADLHATWLLGIRGRIANGVGGILLLLLNLTGLVIWWPGVKLWPVALRVDFRRSWRRINFDLHRATGFWALSLVCIWAISGIYFGWPAQVTGWVDRLSPLITARPPVVHVPASTAARPVALSAITAQARLLDPNTELAGITFPYSRHAPYEVLMRRDHGIGREYTDVLYFSPADGTHLETWRYGVNQSLGDWFIWLQVPLHFGTYWGLGVKIVWALVGLTIPLLAVTGALLYWNRVLRRKWATVSLRTPRERYAHTVRS